MNANDWQWNDPGKRCGICDGHGMFDTESRDGSLLFITAGGTRKSTATVACSCSKGDRFSDPRGNLSRFSRSLMKLPAEIKGLITVDHETGATEAEMAEWDALS